MHNVLELVSSTRRLRGSIQLPASKSISNRMLILEAVSSGLVKGTAHSTAADTRILQELLHTMPADAYAGAGGTTFRFMLAYLSGCVGYEGILRGSDRLMERPVAPLVDALRLAGADIQYINKEGFAPLKIRGKQLQGGRIPVDATVSSQFISALMLVAPMMKHPLELEIRGELISPAYVNMTAALMERCGFAITEHPGLITVQNILPEQSVVVTIERDWSAASYWYSFVALSEHAEIILPGLHSDSMQGDVACAQAFLGLGVESLETSQGITLRKIAFEEQTLILDCFNTPDLFQTYAVTATGLKIQAVFSGLQSLRGKETDRIAAMRKELEKAHVFTNEPSEGEFTLDARQMQTSEDLTVDTYEDHRMAMAFAPLVLKFPRLAIRNPDVVVKSYPEFWSELRKVGVSIAEWGI